MKPTPNKNAAAVAALLKSILGDRALSPEGRDLMASFRQVTFDAIHVDHPLKPGERSTADRVLEDLAAANVTPSPDTPRACAKALGIFAALSHEILLSVVLAVEVGAKIENIKIEVVGFNA